MLWAHLENALLSNLSKPIAQSSYNYNSDNVRICKASVSFEYRA